MTSNNEERRASYRDLQQNLDVAFKRSQDGVRACKAILVFFQQTATLEESFGAALVKVGEGFAGIHEQNGPSLNKAIASICAAIQGLGRQHGSLAGAITQDVCRNMSSFTEQQMEQVRRMISETQSLVEDITRERATHRKVRDKYRKACRDAEAVIKVAALKGGKGAGADVSPELPHTSEGASPTNAGLGGLQKIDALWNKVWDQLNASGTSSKPIGERAKDALAALEEVEAEYDASRRRIEKKEADYLVALEERLMHFQTNEESRAHLVKQQLQRLQSSRKAALDRMEKTVKAIREAAEEVDVNADYAVYVSQMAKVPSADAAVGGVDGTGVDASVEKWTQPSLEHVDRCVKNLRGLCHCFSELAAAEETYAKGLTKLSDKSGFPDPDAKQQHHPHRKPHTPNLRVGPARSIFRKFIESEGKSMQGAWEGYMRANHAIARLHLVTASRVAESVCVILAQTQDELTGTRQEVSVAQTAAFKTFSATRATFIKARDRAENKTRDLQDREQELRGVDGSNGAAVATSSGQVTGASLSISASGGGSSGPGNNKSKLEVKVMTLREEVQNTEMALEQAAAALKDEKASLVTEFDIIIRALAEREEDRLTKMRMALGELYHAQSQAYISTVEEEEKRRLVIDAINVMDDLECFVRAAATGGWESGAVQVAKEALGDPRYSSLLASRLASLLQLVKEEEEEEKAAAAAIASPDSPGEQAADPATRSSFQSDMQIRYSDLSNGLIGRTSLLPHSMSIDTSGNGESGADLSASSSAAVRRSLDGSVGSLDISFLSDEEGEEDEEDEEELVLPPAPPGTIVGDAAAGEALEGGVPSPEARSGSGTPRAAGSPARAMMRSRAMSAHALATTRLPESMSPRPFLSPGRGAREGPFSETATLGLALGGDDAPFSDQQSNAMAPKEEEVAGQAPASQRRQAYHSKHPLLFPEQTLSSSLFRGIELAQSIDVGQSQQDAVPVLSDQTVVPGKQEEDGTAVPELKAAEPDGAAKPTLKPTEPTGDRSVFRPIAPQPTQKDLSNDVNTSTKRPSSSAAVAPTTAMVPAVAADSRPSSTGREGLRSSSSLSSTLSSSFTRSLSLTLPRPPTPQQRSTTPRVGEVPTSYLQGTSTTSLFVSSNDDGGAEEIKVFNLPPTEKLVESYSCALLPNNLLIHGRLFICTHFVCFGSWGSTRLVLPMETIDFIEKSNTMGFVPNALWVIMKTGERYFFSSFLYRDNCFDLLQKVLPKKHHTIELKTLPEKKLQQMLRGAEQQQPVGGDSTTVVGDVGGPTIADGVTGQKKGEPSGEVDHTPMLARTPSPSKAGEPKTASPTAVATAAGSHSSSSSTPPLVARRVSFSDNNSADQTSSGGIPGGGASVANRAGTPAPTTAPTPPPAVLQEDLVIRRMTMLTAETLDTSVDMFLSELWGESSSFYTDYLAERGDKEIQMGEWVDREEQDAYSGESFSRVREVRYHRNRAGETVGPRLVLTRECQMYRIDETGDRAVLTTVLSFTGIPYCDYFIVQTRWILTRTLVNDESRCKLQVGLDVVFRQNLLLKAAIRSGTEGEVKRMLQNYLVKARARLVTKALVGSGPSVSTVPSAAGNGGSASSAEAASTAAASTSSGGGTSAIANSGPTEGMALADGRPLRAASSSTSVAVVAASAAGSTTAGVGHACKDCFMCRLRHAVTYPEGGDKAAATPAGRVLSMVYHLLASAFRIMAVVLEAAGFRSLRDMVLLALCVALLAAGYVLTRMTGRLQEVAREMVVVSKEQERLVQQLTALQRQYEQLQQQQQHSS